MTRHSLAHPYRAGGPKRSRLLAEPSRQAAKSHHWRCSFWRQRFRRCGTTKRTHFAMDSRACSRDGTGGAAAALEGRQKPPGFIMIKGNSDTADSRKTRRLAQTRCNNCGGLYISTCGQLVGRPEAGGWQERRIFYLGVLTLGWTSLPSAFFISHREAFMRNAARGRRRIDCCRHSQEQATRTATSLGAVSERPAHARAGFSFSSRTSWAPENFAVYSVIYVAFFPWRLARNGDDAS